MERGEPDQETRRVNGRKKRGPCNQHVGFYKKKQVGKVNIAPEPEKFMLGGRVCQPTQQVWIK